MTERKLIIYKKLTMPTQSGAKINWFVKFDSHKKSYTEPIMLWSGSKNTSNLINLSFNSLEDAIIYANSTGHEYRIEDSCSNSNDDDIKSKKYADNFTKY